MAHDRPSKDEHPLVEGHGPVEEQGPVEGHDQAQYPLPRGPRQEVPGPSGPGRKRSLSVRFVGDVTRTSPAPLVLLHGFTQTGASWASVVSALDGRFPVVLPDAPGHGGSSSVRANLWQTAHLLAEAVPTGAAWVGYSMGGRTALHLALSHPEAVGKLVLISTSAGIDDPAKRAARQNADEALAQRIEREGMDKFLSTWLAQPLFATLSPEDAGLADRLTNTPAGLASSLRLAGAGAQEPLWGRLGELGQHGAPILLLAGELDLDYRHHAERMAALIGPTAAIEVVPGAGHACHLERPGEVAEAIARFCRTGPEPV